MTSRERFSSRFTSWSSSGGERSHFESTFSFFQSSRGSADQQVVAHITIVDGNVTVDIRNSRTTSCPSYADSHRGRSES
jgi:hypothetical protein